MNLYVILSILSLIVCALLILIVLVQNSKGGGLASNFSSSNQYMGVRKTADFLEKSTWTLAIVLMVIAMLSVFTVPNRNSESQVQEFQEISRENPVADPVQPPPEEIALPGAMNNNQ